MAQLVFVHGVATRDSTEYRLATASRDALFRDLLFSGRNVSIRSPMWGQFVPLINPGVFETDRGVQTYSLNVTGIAGLGGGLQGNVGAGGSQEISIGTIGKQDPVAALDAICLEIADRAARERRELKPEEMQVFRRASELIVSDTALTAFAGDASPKAISDHLCAGAPAAFGISSFVAEAVSAVTDRVRNAVSTLGFGAVRGKLSPAVGLFIGDVFVYLKDGERRQKIRSEVGKALTEASAAVKSGDGPLVVIGHSMGGVILVDMLMNPASAQLPDGLIIDALLTVGSQPGFFAALQLLKPSSTDQLALRKPDCIRHWLNVFDPIDPLAFRTDVIFQDAIDLSFNSVTGITEAHSKYFLRPQFYARSRKRLQEFGILE